MRSFYLIRHAKSSWSDMSLRDFDRPLNKRGFRDAPFMSKMLAGKGVNPDVIVSSPANRAITTAGYFADALKIDKKDIILKEDIYEAWTTTILEVIKDLKDEWKTVLIFGHNPAFTDVANEFSTSYLPNLPTCGIVKIESSADRWSSISNSNSVLTEFHYPKQYFT